MPSARDPQLNSRRFLIALGIVVVIALALRLGVSVQLLRSYPPVSRPTAATDMYTYQQLATQVLDGEYPLDKGFYYQPFYYAVFLPTVYAVFGRGAGGVIIVQALLGSACVWLTGLTFARLFGRPSGLVAATLLALSRFHTFYTPFCLIAVLQSFWFALFIYLAVRARQTNSTCHWGGAGLICGLATLTRGNMALLLPLLLALICRRNRRRPRLLAVHVGVAVFLWYAPQLPFAWANDRATGRWTGPSTAAGAVLALGNTPEAPPGGRDPDAGAGPMEYPEICLEWTRLAGLDGPARVPVARSIAGWIRREPLAFLELKFRMLLLFWHRSEIPNNIAIARGDKRVPSPLLHAPVLTDFWLIGSLGLAGMGLAVTRRRHHSAVIFAAAAGGVYCLSIVMFYILARFRLPLLPLLCGFGGYAACAVWNAVSRGRRGDRRRRYLVEIGAVAAALLLVTVGFDVYRYGWEARVMRLVRPRGLRLELPGAIVVKDHGPLSFGGWIPLPLAEAHGVRKTFCLRPADATTHRAVLRFPVTGAGGELRLRLAGDTSDRVLPLSRGLHWLELPLTGAALDPVADGVAVTLEVRAAPDEAAWIVDTQRDDGRTRINGHTVAGEWVAELRLPHDAR